MAGAERLQRCGFMGAAVIDVSSYPCRFLIGVDARLPSRCKVAEHVDGVSGAALVGIDPVFT